MMSGLGELRLPYNRMEWPIMPLTKKGRKIKNAMRKQYGSKSGERVFYASKNKGTIKGVDKSRTKSKGRKR